MWSGHTPRSRTGVFTYVMTNTYAVFRLKSRRLPPLSLLVALSVGEDCSLMSSLLGDAVQVFRSPKEQLVTSDRRRRIKSLIKVVGGNRFIARCMIQNHRVSSSAHQIDMTARCDWR